MSTYREVVFIIRDLIKLNTSQSYFEEEHVIYLMHQYRMFLLKQRYSDIRKDIADINFQTIKLPMALYPTSTNNYIRPDVGQCLKSTFIVPAIINVNSVPSTTTRVRNFLTGKLYTFINFDRLHFIGSNKWLKNIIYCATGTGADNGYLFIKAGNTTYTGTGTEDIITTGVLLTSLFENPLDAYALDSAITQKAKLDFIFPLEAPLIPNLVDMVLKELLGAAYRPTDDVNNEDDNMSNMANFTRQNTKNPVTKTIDDGQ